MPRRKSIPIPDRPNLDHEQRLWGEGFRVVAGLDEAGRGAWAGPVYAAAVALPQDERVCQLLSGVRDSKRMTALQRDRWQDCIKSISVAWAVGSASAAEIDAQGILPATCLAMQRALDQLVYSPTYLLLDYIALDSCSCPQLSMPKGDCRSLSIAAASVLAKTARDACMAELETGFPGYHFSRHKGYGTALHRAALEKLGPCAEHRRSFRPVSEMAIIE